MIYTVTLNPSLDYTVTVQEFALGKTNRTASEQMFPGGKGINVSMVLKNLGIASTALGFVAGFTGEEICRKIGEIGINNEFKMLDSGISRINVKLKNYDGTEINGMGPQIPKKVLDEFMERLDKLQAGDILVLAGSIPASVPVSVYRDICCMLADREVRIVVDATGKLLLEVLEYHPFLIKPNHHELGELFGVKIESHEEALYYAAKLQEKGAANVLVSMGGKGAVLAAQTGERFQMSAPQGKLVNAVGAGDSMVAGFLAGYLEKKEYGHAFRMGVASGSASAFSEKLANKVQIQTLLEKLESQ